MEPRILGDREKAAILAALRHYADVHDDYDGTVSFPHHDVATQMGRFDALGADDLNELADEIAMTTVLVG